MPDQTRVCLAHRRALTKTLMFTRGAPGEAALEPRIYVRALRSALRMSQRQLAARSGVSQEFIARFEGGRTDCGVATLRRLLDAMFCDLLVLPFARKRPGDALADQCLIKPQPRRVWD
jgi:hypothetical protein